MDDALSDSIPLRSNNIGPEIRQDSLFLKLPSELRNRVYEFVGVEEAGLHLKSQDRPNTFGACRQIRSEFQHIYYSDKVMRAEVWDAMAEIWRRIEDPNILENILAGKGAQVMLGTNDLMELRASIEQKRLFKDPLRWGVLTLAQDRSGFAHKFCLFDKFGAVS